MKMVSFSSFMPSKPTASQAIATIKPQFSAFKPTQVNDLKGNFGGQDRVQFGCGCGRGGC